MSKELILPEPGESENATNEKAKCVLSRAPRSKEEAAEAAAENLKGSAKKAA